MTTKTLGYLILFLVGFDASRHNWFRHKVQARGQVTAAEDIIDEDNCAGERDEDIARDDRDEDLATASEVDSDDDSDDDSDEESDLEFLITEDEGMDATEEDEIEII